MDDDSLLEAIAENVHCGWAAEKQRQGFADHVYDPWGNWQPTEGCYRKCGFPRDKHHADMLPYSELAENVKEYDRASVRAVFDGIVAAGYRIVKAD